MRQERIHVTLMIELLSLFIFESVVMFIFLGKSLNSHKEKVWKWRNFSHIHIGMSPIMQCKHVVS